MDELLERVNTMPAIQVKGRCGRAMGGRVALRGQLGVGWTVSVHLPARRPVAGETPFDAAPSAATGAAIAAAEDLGGMRVLVAEDDAVNPTVVQEMLHTLNAQATTCGDGAHIVAHVRSQGAADVAAKLMDLQMPAMDGYAATRALKRLDPDLLIIALTAHALLEDARRLHEAGLVECLVKPFSLQALANVLKRRVRPPAPPAQPAPEPCD